MGGNFSGLPSSSTLSPVLRVRVIKIVQTTLSADGTEDPDAYVHLRYGNIIKKTQRCHSLCSTPLRASIEPIDDNFALECTQQNLQQNSHVQNELEPDRMASGSSSSSATASKNIIITLPHLSPASQHSPQLPSLPPSPLNASISASAAVGAVTTSRPVHTSHTASTAAKMRTNTNNNIVNNNNNIVLNNINNNNNNNEYLGGKYFEETFYFPVSSILSKNQHKSLEISVWDKDIDLKKLRLSAIASDAAEDYVGKAVVVHPSLQTSPPLHTMHTLHADQTAKHVSYQSNYSNISATATGSLTGVSMSTAATGAAGAAGGSALDADDVQSVRSLETVETVWTMDSIDSMDVGGPLDGLYVLPNTFNESKRLSVKLMHRSVDYATALLDIEVEFVRGQKRIELGLEQAVEQEIRQDMEKERWCGSCHQTVCSTDTFRLRI